jgi:Mrp family chromosome partitioning ATPase
MKVPNEEYASLRVTLESMIRTPAILVVGAASEEDGTGTLACHLGKAFAEAGYNTVLVDPSGGEAAKEELGLKVPAVADIAAIPVSATNGAIKNLSAVAMAQTAPHTTTSYLKMLAAADALRAKYDVTIVDAGSIALNPVAMQFAVAGDGVVLAFRFGRKPARADQDLMSSLRRIGANVLGVVAVGREQDRRPEPSARPVVETPVAAEIKLPMPAMPIAAHTGEVAITR